MLAFLIVFAVIGLVAYFARGEYIKDKKEKEEKERRTKEIQGYINQLITISGVKPDYNDEELRVKFNSRLYADCILEIMRVMGLQNSVKVTLYSNEKFPRNDCAAYVNIPQNSPAFGSNAFGSQRIQIAIRESITDKYQTFIYTIAHELSHIILHGCFHSLRESEIATDLFVMVSGFKEIVGKGRQIENYNYYDNRSQTRHFSYTTYGYLSYEQFTCAKDFLKTLSEKSTHAKVKTSSIPSSPETLYYSDKGSIAIFQKTVGVINIGDMVSVKKNFNINDWKTEYIMASDGRYNVFDKSYTAINNRNNFYVEVKNGRVTNVVL